MRYVVSVGPLVILGWAGGANCPNGNYLAQNCATKRRRIKGKERKPRQERGGTKRKGGTKILRVEGGCAYLHPYTVVAPYIYGGVSSLSTFCIVVAGLASSQGGRAGRERESWDVLWCPKGGCAPGLACRLPTYPK